MGFKRHIPRIIGTLVVVAVGVLTIRFVRDFMDSPPAPQKKGPQQITLIAPPPPPPPPPQEKPPEPEVKEEVKLEDPEPVEDLPEEASDEPPAGENLGVDAEGGAGGDGFGLIGRKGGRGLLSGGDPFVMYASRLQERIEDSLTGDADVRRKAYSVVARIWVDGRGRIERAELDGSTGDRDMDAALERSLNALPPLAAAPPPDMPQPIRLRISSRL